jgi:hypothetical protein
MQFSKSQALIFKQSCGVFHSAFWIFFPKELGECDLLQGDNRTRLLTAPLSSIKRIFSFLFTYTKE